MKNDKEMSEKMNEFLDKVDALCYEYGYEIYPTIHGWTGETDENGKYKTIAIIGNELAKEKKLIEYCKQNIDQRIKIVIKLPQFGARTSKATLINLPQKNNDGSEKVDLTKGNTKEDPIVLE
nr:hypothetical protein [uncultured Flavobacterium sp.]